MPSLPSSLPPPPPSPLCPLSLSAPPSQPPAMSTSSLCGNAFAVIGYGMCSSLMLVVNKLAVHYLPAPSFVLLIQFFASWFVVKAFGVCGAIEVDSLEWRKLRAFLPISAAFIACVYANMKTLQFANVCIHAIKGPMWRVLSEAELRASCCVATPSTCVIRLECTGGNLHRLPRVNSVGHLNRRMDVPWKGAAELSFIHLPSCPSLRRGWVRATRAHPRLSHLVRVYLARMHMVCLHFFQA